MRVITLVAAAAAFLAVCSNAVLAVDSSKVVCPPAEVVTANNAFISLNSTLYKYEIPNLKLDASQDADLICTPGSLQNGGQSVQFANSNDNHNSIIFSAADLSYTKSGDAAPYTSPYYIAHGGPDYTDGADTYTYQQGYLIHKQNNQEVGRIALNTQDNNSAYINGDADVPNRIHLATHNTEGRGAGAFTFFTITKNPFALVRPGVQLPNTANAGCPVQPQECGVNVLLDFQVLNDIATYATSISNNNDFEVTVFTYDARCDVLKQTKLGSSVEQQSYTRCAAVSGGNDDTGAPESQAPGTNAPATNAPASSAPSPNAPATSAPGPNAPATSAPAPTTKAPATTAVPTTKAPTSTVPGGATKGDDTARQSSSAASTVAGLAGAAALAAAAVL